MMLDRRSLLKSGAAISGTIMVPGLGAAVPLHTSQSLDRFIADSRVADSLIAARTAAASGIQVSEVDGDLTSLWYNDLNLKWQQRPMTLAGLTGEDALFVLSTLAPQYGMRIIRQEQFGLIDGLPQSSLFESSLPIYSWMIAPA